MSGQSAVESSHTPSKRADLQAVKLPPQDLLETMFLLQRQLMERYHEIEEANGSPVIYEDQEGQINDRQVQARLRQLFGFAIQEWSEALQELKNKPWKQTERSTNYPAFVEEVADVLHFFIEFCITAGITVEDLYDNYTAKHRKNQERQSNGY